MGTKPVLMIALLASAGALAIARSAAAAETPAEAPFALDTVEVTAEKRTELAFRALQLGLARDRSDRTEDLDKLVCLRQTPTGSHVPVINCATNRKWSEIRARTLATGLAGVENTGPKSINFGGQMMDAGGNTMQRSANLAAGAGGASGATIKPGDDKVFSMSVNDFYKLKQRYGELPPELREAAPAAKD